MLSIEDILAIIFSNSQIKPLKFFPLPIELYNENSFATIYTSFGWPFNCPYCVNKFLNTPFFKEIADSMKYANFKDLRLSLEIANEYLQKKWI